MPQQTAKKQDKSTRLIYARLKHRFPDLPIEMEKVVYRYNPASIQVRVIDPTFAGMTYTQREESIADILTAMPSAVRTNITLLLLLTPKEAQDPSPRSSCSCCAQLLLTPKEAQDPSDLMNLEFDDPISSYL